MGTAAVTTGSLVGTFDPNVIDGGPQTILSKANNNEQPALNKLVEGSATFRVRAETSSNNDPVTVINLNTQGLTWIGGDSLRNITTRAWWRNVAGTSFGYLERVQPVIGSAAGTTPALSLNDVGITATSANQQQDRTYRARSGNLTTLQLTPTYQNAGVFISSSAVVVRCQGNLAGQDLRWLVEVDVGPLKIIPVAVT